MRFFTSDQHENHARILLYYPISRPFKDLDEMRHQLITRFNAKVTKNDLTYHVGDFSMKPASVQPLLSQLNGSHILIPGNHDRVHRCHSKYLKSIPKYLEDGFKEIHQELFIELAGEQVRLNHMPYRTEKEEKYQQFRPVNDGKWLLHGHRHSTPEERIRDKQIDVGVDANNLTPVSEEEIVAIMKAEPQ